MLGLNSSEWAASPLRSHDAFSLRADKDKYTLGETASLSLQNHWPGANVLLTWGNEGAVQTSVKTKVPAGPVSLSVPLGPECLGGCTVLVMMSVPREEPAQYAAPKVPTSKLFDPLAPHQHASTVTLNVVEVGAPEGAAVHACFVLPPTARPPQNCLTHTHTHIPHTQYPMHIPNTDV